MVREKRCREWSIEKAIKMSSVVFNPSEKLNLGFENLEGIKIRLIFIFI